MKFGIDYFPDADPDRVSGQQYFAEVLDFAEQADRLGYDSVKIVEHNVMQALGMYREQAYAEHDGHPPITRLLEG